MHKVGRRDWVVLILLGGCLLATFLLEGGIELLRSATLVVIAAGGQEAAARSDCNASYRTPSFGGTVVIDTNAVVCHDLTIFGGTVVINGKVKGDIAAFGAKVVIGGTVNGNIQMYGGNLALEHASSVHGEIRLYGSKWERASDAMLQGSVTNYADSIGWLLPSNDGFTFPLWPLLAWVGLGLLLTWLLPEHVMLVRMTVASKIGRSLALGLLSIPLAPTALVVLIALVVSIPLAIIVALGLVAAWAFGTVAVGWLVGDAILKKIAPQYNTRRAQIVVGLAGLVLLSSLPYVGWLISAGTGLVGLGAVLLSRFGTRLYTNPKQPLPL